MKYLITGGAGFIGSHLTDKLIEKGEDVVVIDNFSSGKKENINSKAKVYDIDILSPEINNIFKKENPYFLFHLASQINLRRSIENPFEDAKNNILGSINIFEACKKTNVEKIIFSSSGGGVYGKEIPSKEGHDEEPISPYGISKLSSERYLSHYGKKLNIPSVSLRFSNVYGPRQNPFGEAGVVAIFTNLMLQGKEPTIIGEGKQKRDFIYIDDIISALILSLNKEIEGVFNVSKEEEISIIEVFEKIKLLTGFKGGKVHAKEAKGEKERVLINSSKLKEKGWNSSFSFDEGIKKTIEWFSL